MSDGDHQRKNRRLMTDLPFDIETYRGPTFTEAERLELDELARRIACAFVSYQMDTTYETARRNYGDETPGDFWLAMARLAILGFRSIGRS